MKKIKNIKKIIVALRINNIQAPKTETDCSSQIT